MTLYKSKRRRIELTLGYAPVGYTYTKWRSGWSFHKNRKDWWLVIFIGAWRDLRLSHIRYYHE